MNVKRLSTVLLAGAAIFATGCGNKSGAMTKEQAKEFVRTHYTKTDEKIPNKAEISLDISKLTKVDTLGVTEIAKFFGFTWVDGTDHYENKDLYDKGIMKQVCCINDFKPVNEKFIEDTDVEDPNPEFTTNGNELTVKHGSSYAIVGKESGKSTEHFDSDGYILSREGTFEQNNPSQDLFTFSMKITLIY